MMRSRIYQLGHRLDPNDPRDFILSLPKRTLPAKVDLRARMLNQIRDQGKLGSCTGFAGAGHREYLLANRQKQLQCLLSPMFLYYQTRLIDGSTRLDSGATLRDTMKALQKYGVCPEELMPYDPEGFRDAPDAETLRQATAFQIDSYARLKDTAAMQQVLAQEETFLLGFSVYESIESAEVRKSGIVTLPRSGEAQIGGHAVHVVGYLPLKGKMHLLFANSWGQNWGKNGFGLLPFVYLEHMPFDAWIADVGDL